MFIMVLLTIAKIWNQASAHQQTNGKGKCDIAAILATGGEVQAVGACFARVKS
jgi:hypothetical protein